MCHPFVYTSHNKINIMMIRLFSCIILAPWLLVSGAEVMSPCADSTWHFNNETGCCYKTTPNVSTWFDGTAMCAKLHQGAQLASLHSEQESKWVAKSYKNGIDGIHAWTGLSQTKAAHNWTYTDGSKPWSWFHAPFPFVHNHTSCVEIIDNWLVELVQNSGKTQPVFCYTLLKSLCKYCPAPPSRSARAVEVTTQKPATLPHQAAKLEKAHPRSNGVLLEGEGCGKAAATVTLPPTTTLRSILISKVEAAPQKALVSTPKPTTVVPPTTTVHKSVVGREFDFPKNASKTASPPSTTPKPQLEVNAHPTTKTTLPSATTTTVVKKLRGCDGELKAR